MDGFLDLYRFWECPNGKTCKYRHALPPGFVLKKKETEEERKARIEEEKESTLTIEDFLETERHNLGSNLTPVTAESFAVWKAQRNEREEMEESMAKKKKAEEFKKMKAGMKSGVAFSGKDLFDFNPQWAQDQDDLDAVDEYERQASDEEGNLEEEEEEVADHKDGDVEGSNEQVAEIEG
jgi:DRG Family Regulatory Proteins, Tma46